jgi:methylphosphotriester-DNA--protein-cysteine methyltransferase
MSETLTALFLRALETATDTLGNIARRIGRSPRTFHAYSRREFHVPPKAVHDLARYLRERATALNKTADKLEAAADQEERS